MTTIRKATAQTAAGGKAARGLEDLPAVAGGRPLRDEFLIFGQPLIGEEEIAEVVATLRSGWLSTGPRTKRFEHDLGAYLGVEHVLGLNSCTAALHLALLSAGVGPGDEVIVPAMTFAATVNVVEHVGARPVFADAAQDSYNIDPAAVQACLTPRTKAVIPVHFAGLPCRMDEIAALAAKAGVAVIEDAAHALGSEYRGRKIGTLGDFTCFSFYVTKNIATAEGGALVCRQAAADARARVMSLHGMDLGAWQRYSKHGNKHYDVVYPGYKYNLTDLASAIGLHQLKRLDEFIAIRKRYARMLHDMLGDLEEMILPPVEEDADRHAWHLYPVMVRPEKLTVGRDEVMEAVTKENIGVGVHYRAVPTHSYYREKYGYRRGQFPHAEFISERTFSLPLQPRMTEDDVACVARAVRRVVAYYRKPTFAS